MTQDKLLLQALGVALGQLEQFFSDSKECDALLVEVVSPVPMFAALMSYDTSTSCQRRQDFVELAKGIVFAACTSGFQLKTVLTGRFSRRKRAQGLFHLLFCRFNIQLLQNR